MLVLWFIWIVIRRTRKIILTGYRNTSADARKIAWDRPDRSLRSARGLPLLLCMWLQMLHSNLIVKQHSQVHIWISFKLAVGVCITSVRRRFPIVLPFPASEAPPPMQDARRRDARAVADTAFLFPGGLFWEIVNKCFRITRKGS